MAQSIAARTTSDGLVHRPDLGPELSDLAATVSAGSRREGEPLSYEDMARSHVKELVREAFGLGELVVDEDGDLPFPSGTAMFYVSVVSGGRLVRVWSRAVTGIEPKKAVLREINDANAGLVLARVHATGPCVWVEGCLPVESVAAGDLGRLCYEVGTTADRLGSMLAAVHGGSVAFPDGCDAEHERED
jgi:hypothetical protein